MKTFDKGNFGIKEKAIYFLFIIIFVKRHSSAKAQ